MPTVHPDPREENPYVIDAESATEMARLVHQDRLLTSRMNGPIEEQFERAGVHDILDIACGPGSWVLDMAYNHSETTIVGIDTSRSMIDYANAQAKVQWRDNVSFEVMDALKPLNFPDNSFDIVNARLLIGFMPPAAWPKLVQECKRILRPGGLLRLTECENPLSTSAAAQKLYGKLAEALSKANMSFSADSYHLGITPKLGRFLHDAGFSNIQSAGYGFDFSAWTDLHNAFTKDLTIVLKLLQPFLLKMEVITPEDFEETYQQMMMETLSDDFCAVWYYFSVWGTKPA